MRKTLWTTIMIALGIAFAFQPVSECSAQPKKEAAADPLYPVIVRSTALSLLVAYPGEDTTRAFELALMDDEALIRRTAVQR